MTRADMGMLRALLALLAPALAAACVLDATGPRRRGEPIQTDRLAYVATYRQGAGAYRRYGFALVSTIRNPTGQTLYLGRCFEDSPQPLYEVELPGATDPLASGYFLPWACVGHDRQFELPPGASRTDTLDIVGPTAWDGHTGVPLGALEGRFRLRYDVRTAPADGADLAPDSLARSNLFDVTLEH